MRRYLIYIITVVTAALMMWSCAADFDSINGDHSSAPEPSRPTVPIKRRPIVPSTKLPRPRLIAKVAWSQDNTLAVRLVEDVAVAEVIVRDRVEDKEYAYIFEGDSIDVTLPDHSVEVEVRVGDERYLYIVEE
ncbi:MAG: hypothetical protein IKJ38_06180 [Alistipes sp.]|nr:hypothetical protein [Alistipes sp.]